MAKDRKRLVREQFRAAVFSRDGHRCVFCPRADMLDAHHITDRNEMPNGGYVKENGITLCPDHHTGAEEFHVTGGVSVELHPTKLYEKIGSSYELALAASRKLSR